MSITATKFLPFHKPTIEQEEVDAVVGALKSGWLTKGPRVREFEMAFSRYIGAKEAVAVNSCTAALHIALAAIDIRAGDEVIIPTMTFAATGEVVLYFQALPVLVDCCESTGQIDPKAVERAITPRTRAIIPVHYAGAPCEMDAILEIARRNNLKVIEDAAHALPTFYKGRMVGTIGDVTCFSFYATKTITTGEGGMATTEDEDLAERMRILSLHGISKDAWNRYSAEGNWRYDIMEAGFKYNMTDPQAALGLVQLAKCDAMRQRRSEIASRYTHSLDRLDCFVLPISAPNGEHAWHIYPVRIDPLALVINRDSTIHELKERGIGTSVHFIPLHLHSLYQNQLGYRQGQFPYAEKMFETVFSLPIYPSMTDDDVGRVIEGLYDIAGKFRR